MASGAQIVLSSHWSFNQLRNRDSLRGRVTNRVWECSSQTRNCGSERTGASKEDSRQGRKKLSSKSKELLHKSSFYKEFLFIPENLMVFCHRHNHLLSNQMVARDCTSQTMKKHHLRRKISIVSFGQLLFCYSTPWDLLTICMFNYIYSRHLKAFFKIFQCHRTTHLYRSYSTYEQKTPNDPHIYQVTSQGPVDDGPVAGRHLKAQWIQCDTVTVYQL